MAIDRIGRHFESACNMYFRKNNLSGELTSEQKHEVELLAGNHIGLFMRWIIDNHFEGENADKVDCEKVRNGQMTGTEYLMKHNDGELREEDLAPEIQKFAVTYYAKNNDFFADYAECCLFDDDLDVYDAISGDEEYLKLKTRIDEVHERMSK